MKRAYVLALLTAYGCGSSSNPTQPAGQDSGVYDTGAPDVGNTADSGGGSETGSAMEAGGADAAPEGGPGTCTADWCWLQPPPTSPSLSGIWGSSAMDIWVTGDGGVLVHWDGTNWTSTTQGVNNLNGIWGSSATDVWVTGDFGTVLHFDGMSWASSTLTPPAPADAGASDAGAPLALPLSMVTGTAANDAWIVGDMGNAYHYDGSAWTHVDTGTTTNLAWIWAAAANDVWVVGDMGFAAHYDGTTWTPSTTGTMSNLGCVWGTAPNDVWATGKAKTLIHWNGTAWSPTTISSPGDLNGLYGTSATDIWMTGDFGVLYHYDGTGWNPTITGIGTIALADVWAAPGGGTANVWAVGDLGTILRHP